jgi:putative ABC transport system ATP-binding protein
MFNLLPRVPAIEQVEMPLIYAGAKDRRKRAMEALEILGISHRANHRPNELSGGQQQRVAIARALVTNPALILADEPTGNLDSRSGEELMALLQRLNRERGITIVLVTHEREIALHARRIVHIRDGHIVQDEIVERPVKADDILAELPAEEEDEEEETPAPR